MSVDAEVLDVRRLLRESPFHGKIFARDIDDAASRIAGHRIESGHAKAALEQMISAGELKESLLCNGTPVYRLG